MLKMVKKSSKIPNSEWQLPLTSPVSLEFTQHIRQFTQQHIRDEPKSKNLFADNGRPAGQNLSSPIDGGSQEGA